MKFPKTELLDVANSSTWLCQLIELSDDDIHPVQFLQYTALVGLIIGMAINYRKWYQVWKNVQRDTRYLFRLVKALYHLYFIKKDNLTVSKVFEKIAAKDPEKVVFYYKEQKWTTDQVVKLSNKIANYFKKEGFKKGNIVALFMENRPEYFCVWLGLSKIGVVTALINTNLRFRFLLNCLGSIDCKAVIYSNELSSALRDASEMGNLPNALYNIDSPPDGQMLPNVVDLDKELQYINDLPPNLPCKINFHDQLLCIFTSGTTGTPKAAIIKHSKYILYGMLMYFMHGIRKDDKILTVLPLYHSAGTMLAGGVSIIFGIPLVIETKFSASTFWETCVRHKVTIFQYIGEICRYLIAQEYTPYEKTHSVRMMIGNGLRKEVWGEFAKRFRIPMVNEIYGATESNCFFANIDGKLGAVGFHSFYMSWILKYKLIKLDEETGEPARDKRGRVIECKTNEPGELIGRVGRNNPFREFNGYANAESKEKILENAFGKGDMWYRTGDVLMKDCNGYVYFVDRKGDTFRWKGENCSTVEIESAIGSEIGLNDVVVFGVEIPNCEGKAGMAVIAGLEESVDLDALSSCINKSLPPYARPVFIRFVKEIEKTGTFKFQKENYKRDGFDITRVPEKIYVLRRNKYVPLTPTVLDGINQGIHKF